MKIYTKKGDGGGTSLFGGKAISKAALRVCAYGDVDELNAAIGVVVASGVRSAGPILTEIQRDLFTVGAQLARPRAVARGAAMRRTPSISPNRVRALEQWIDEAEARLTSLREFILPGGALPAALLHLARAVARRAERTVVALAKKETVDPLVIVYLNRLSDLLFVAARLENKTAVPAVDDQPWHGG